MKTAPGACAVSTALSDRRRGRGKRRRALALRTAAVLCLAVPAPPAACARDYRLQTLETAHALFRSATNSTMYAEAAKQYEYLVNEEGIRNGRLFYTLGNSWFMAEDTGRAILYYRRAEKYLPNNADLQHNLQEAMALRVDHIPGKALHPLADRLLGWHYHTPAALRWRLFGVCWLLFWIAWLWTARTTKKEARIAAVVTGMLSAILLASLVTETALDSFRNPGVITARAVAARKGDGMMYAQAFVEPLHAGTEFETLDHRGTWLHVRLADGQTCWIPEDTAELIRLD